MWRSCSSCPPAFVRLLFEIRHSGPRRALYVSAAICNARRWCSWTAGAELCLVSYLADGVLCPPPTSSPTTYSPWNCIVAVIIIPVNDPTATDSCSCALTGWCPKTRDADFPGRCRECQGQPCRDRVSPGRGRVMASQYVHHGICQSWSAKGTPGARPLRLRPSALGERQDYSFRGLSDDP